MTELEADTPVVAPRAPRARKTIAKTAELETPAIPAGVQNGHAPEPAEAPPARATRSRARPVAVAIAEQPAAAEAAPPENRVESAPFTGRSESDGGMRTENGTHSEGEAPVEGRRWRRDRQNGSQPQAERPLAEPETAEPRQTERQFHRRDSAPGGQPGGDRQQSGDRAPRQQQENRQHERPQQQPQRFPRDGGNRFGRDRDRGRNEANRFIDPNRYQENRFPPPDERFSERDEAEYEARPRREGPALPAMNIAELEVMTREALIEIAEQLTIEGATSLRKPDLIFKLLQAQAETRGNIFTGGFLEVSDDGNYGFLRGERMLPGPHDIYVSQAHLRRFAMRPGDYVTGQVRNPKDNEKYYGLLKVEAVNGMDPEVAKKRPFFENLTAIFPNEQLHLETTADNLTHRIIDLIAPIGKGSRGLIVSPPKAGKTILLKNIANGITENHPDVHLMVVLVGERPEEVTDMQRNVRGEVVSSTFDEPVEDHTRVAEMAFERAKRLVEGGKDVVILMDSITRLTRAYNLALPPSGRTLSGGVDPVALYPPKRLFGAARKCEEGGSLTVLATCLVDTGSRMDEVVFEEFKGTGNLELRLDRKLAERRFYPAIDIQASSTRREELLLDEKALKGVWLVRRMTAMISQNSPNQLEATERLLERIARTSTNEEFLSSLKTDL